MTSNKEASNVTSGTVHRSVIFEKQNVSGVCLCETLCHDDSWELWEVAMVMQCRI